MNLFSKILNFFTKSNIPFYLDRYENGEMVVGTSDGECFFELKKQTVFFYSRDYSTRIKKSSELSAILRTVKKTFY